MSKSGVAAKLRYLRLRLNLVSGLNQHDRKRNMRDMGQQRQAKKEIECL